MNSVPARHEIDASRTDHRSTPIVISASASAALQIESPGTHLERLSPGLEPLSMEPIALASRP